MRTGRPAAADRALAPRVPTALRRGVGHLPCLSCPPRAGSSLSPLLTGLFAPVISAIAGSFWRWGCCCTLARGMIWGCCGVTRRCSDPLAFHAHRLFHASPVGRCLGMTQPSAPVVWLQPAAPPKPAEGAPAMAAACVAWQSPARWGCWYRADAVVLAWPCAGVTATSAIGATWWPSLQASPAGAIRGWCAACRCWRGAGSLRAWGAMPTCRRRPRHLMMHDFAIKNIAACACLSSAGANLNEIRACGAGFTRSPAPCRARVPGGCPRAYSLHRPACQFNGGHRQREQGGVLLYARRCAGVRHATARTGPARAHCGFTFQCVGRKVGDLLWAQLDQVAAAFPTGALAPRLKARCGSLTM